jgi:16S rRNA C1402 (ribose-2'-O) methylase RsmI
MTTTNKPKPHEKPRIVPANVARYICEVLKEEGRRSAWPCNESFFRGKPTEDPSQPGAASPENEQIRTLRAALEQIIIDCDAGLECISDPLLEMVRAALKGDK